MDGKTLALYLIALAMLEANGQTYVSREIREAMNQLQYEIGLK
ncbi:hypothetical protein [Virgibacillus necropolis]|nr:hypothetical protein [Virgibacillus necropolis]